VIQLRVCDVPEAAPGRLLRHHGQVELPPGQHAGQVLAQGGGDRIAVREADVRRPAGRPDVGRRPGQALRVGRQVPQGIAGEQPDGGDAVRAEQLVLVVADDHHGVGLGGGQPPRQHLDRRLGAFELARPDRRPQFVCQRRVRGGQQLGIGVIAAVRAEQPVVALVTGGVLSPVARRGAHLGRVRGREPEHDLSHGRAFLLLRSAAPCAGTPEP
jgi:hypothetical protein